LLNAEMLTHPVQLVTLLAAGGCLVLALASAADTDPPSSPPPYLEYYYRQVVTDFALANNEALTQIRMVDIDETNGYLRQKFGIDDGRQREKKLNVLKQQRAKGKTLLDQHQQLPVELARAGMEWQKCEVEVAAQTLIETQRKLEEKIGQFEVALGLRRPSARGGVAATPPHRLSHHRHHSTVSNHTGH
jgi:hypothetical protein